MANARKSETKLRQITQYRGCRKVEKTWGRWWSVQYEWLKQRPQDLEDEAPAPARTGRPKASSSRG